MVYCYSPGESKRLCVWWPRSWSSWQNKPEKNWTRGTKLVWYLFWQDLMWSQPHFSPWLLLQEASKLQLLVPCTKASSLSSAFPCNEGLELIHSSLIYNYKMIPWWQHRMKQRIVTHQRKAKFLEARTWMPLQLWQKHT